MSQTPTLQPLSTDPFDVPPRSPWRLPRLRSFGLVWPLLALALLLAFDATFTQRFFVVGHRNGRLYGVPIDLLHYAAPIVLLGMGMTLVIATGGVDLSVGAVMAVAATVATLWAADPPVGHGGNVAVGCVLGLLAAAACGAWNGLLVAVFGVQPIVATLILMIAGRGLAQLLSGNLTVELPAGTYGWLHYLAAVHGPLTRLLYPLPLDVLWAALAFVAITMVIRRTALGLFLESVGNNATASRYAGVNATGVTFAAYTLCGLTAGVAGLLEMSELDRSRLGLGLSRELDAILAVSLGGTALAGGRFSLAGTVVGAVIISALNQTVELTHFSGHQISTEWFPVAEAVVILIVCLLQSDVLRSRLLSWVRRPG